MISPAKCRSKTGALSSSLKNLSTWTIPPFHGAEPDRVFTSGLTPAQQSATHPPSEQLNLFATPNDERPRPPATNSRRSTNPVRRPDRVRVAKPSPVQVLGGLYDLVFGPHQPPLTPRSWPTQLVPLKDTFLAAEIKQDARIR